jgi:murein DD-endopeptidase MepM/ murein hydrolase activator NlpD
MSTTRLISVAVALVAAAVAAGSTQAAPHAASRTFAVSESRTIGRLPVVAPAYGWPLKPFDKQHPVRAFLNDPRIGENGGKAFHFGIDIAAPDGTGVYAVTGGKLYLSHGSLCVVAGGGHEYGYWHIRAAAGLSEHQIVHKHQLLGTIAPGWGHVHFAERLGTEYVNPLRPGALGPYTDPLAPTIAGLSVRSDGHRGYDLVVYAHDTTWPTVRGAWANEPVTPALIRWRIGSAGTWRTAVDFREKMLDRRLFDSIYAPDTTQNHKGKQGNFAFYLGRSWRPADGTYRIQIEALDTRGNRALATARVSVVDGGVQ